MRHARATIGSLNNRPVTIEVTLEDGRISFSGAIGRGRNPDGCGQIILTFKEYDSRGYASLAEITGNWPQDRIKAFFDLWDRWHSNNMRPGCPHQMAEGWDKRPINPELPLEAYGKHAGNYPTWNSLGWVTEKEHPAGLLGKACPVCGVRYGHAWHTEEIPEAIIETIFSLMGR